ncbi:MAG: hypothetical protein VXZ82_19970 [Planctomycetota bacterium]|nr:hypothetical protein [Planctomycetota bacterium]
MECHSEVEYRIDSRHHGTAVSHASKARLPQDQRLYWIVNSDGAEAAIAWFERNGKKAAWGGSLLQLSEKLISDDRIEEGLRLMEYDIEATPGKAWLLRKTAQAFLDNGRTDTALIYAKRGLEIRPDDERLEHLVA